MRDYIERELTETVEKRLFSGKALIVYGARQVGKTTLMNRLLAKAAPMNAVSLNGDMPDDRAVLADATPERLRLLLAGKKILFIDEAQNIPNIGMALKRIVDTMPETQVLVSGSSSFDLANKTGEPLTGRKFEYTLMPFSFSELVSAADLATERAKVERRLLYGSYPEIVTHEDDAEERLRLLAGSYLYKDIYALQAVRNVAVLEKLLRALALQCGSEVSNNEIGQLLGLDNKTVARYIDVLCQSFVLFVLPAFSRNARNELKRAKKVYFFDCGIRNAVIGNFLPLARRADVGLLWENYLMSERYKWRLLRAPDTRAYFWRTRSQAEVDLVEESASGLAAFEFKWNEGKPARFPAAFTSAYPDARRLVVNRANYDMFLTESKENSVVG
ncbi:MAG: ATP-binding protein [Desulfobulbaceae bacterium]|jgi:predicted AAA+ superfamily ATPase|nr:ATP-binding protein [Desulfobulbaceae bacterium]